MRLESYLAFVQLDGDDIVSIRPWIVTVASHEPKNQSFIQPRYAVRLFKHLTGHSNVFRLGRGKRNRDYLI